MTRRETLTCIHEPFGDAFYFGPERLSERYEEDKKAREESGFAQSTYKTIFERIENEATEVRSCPSYPSILHNTVDTTPIERFPVYPVSSRKTDSISPLLQISEQQSLYFYSAINVFIPSSSFTVCCNRAVPYENRVLHRLVLWLLM